MFCGFKGSRIWCHRKIKGVPPESIVIRSEIFEEPLTIFNGTKGERKRADFVIVSNDENDRKWVICIETQEMDSKLASHVIQQLKGAYCFISYCKCVGKSFWNSNSFLNDYEYRFVSIVEINPNRSKRKNATLLFQSRIATIGQRILRKYRKGTKSILIS